MGVAVFDHPLNVLGSACWWENQVPAPTDAVGHAELLNAVEPETRRVRPHLAMKQEPT